MRTAATLAVAFVVSSGAVLESAPPVRLSAGEIQEALHFGRRASAREVEQYVLQVAPTWTLNFDTPFLRVAQLAYSSRKRERELKESDVPPSLVAPEVHLYALALQQPGVKDKVRNIAHVTIRRPGSTEVIQPLSVRSSVNRARGRGDFAGGPAALARSVEAAFRPSDLRAGHVVRVEFQDGGHESVAITREMLARVRF